MFKVPEKYRVRTGTMGSDETAGNNGCFVIPMDQKFDAFVVASDGEQWEHISVHLAARKGLQKTPSWNQMCLIKSMFWGEEDLVVQYHPRKSQYVNNHPNVLHLWRPVPGSGLAIPEPDHRLVGIRNQRQSLTDGK